MPATAAEKKAFIEKYKQDFADACYNTGLFPSITMAQAAYESGWGKSELASKYNALFGIKAQKGYIGTKVYLGSTEERNGEIVPESSYFRTYRNVFDGLVDRNKFLKENSRYTKAGVFTAQTPEQQAQALQAAGYSTYSSYANDIMTIVNQNNLKEIDRIAPNKYRSTTQTKVILAMVVVGLSISGYIWLHFKK